MATTGTGITITICHGCGNVHVTYCLGEQPVVTMDLSPADCARIGQAIVDAGKMLVEHDGIGVPRGSA